MNATDKRRLVRIAFDSAALKPKYQNHGIQVYARNLLAALKNATPQHGMEIRPFISAANDYGDIVEESVGFRPRKTSLIQSDRLWRYGGASVAALLSGADVLLNPNGASLSINALIPTVTTIHDLTPMVMPSFSRRIAFLLKSLLMRSARDSAAIITVSEHSKRDIVHVCGVPAEKIHVVYEGYDRSLFYDSKAAPRELQALLAQWKIDRPYILHHGAIQPRKNMTRLIDAYRMMLEQHHGMDFDLVLAGPLAWQYEEVVEAARNKTGSRGRAVITEAISDQDLSSLLRGAALEVIPSLYEGFCLPMVEAMACGIPTIVANQSCLPEISGGVLRYFDPFSAQDMARCMTEVLQSRDLQAELASKGKERAEEFSWELCAEQTLDVLKKVSDAVPARARLAKAAL
jgi:glycosyltransferase involved in cell wall biosynthesis